MRFSHTQSPNGVFYLLFSSSYCLQTALRLIQSSSLSASCSRLLLQIASSLLLGENVTLPKALIQETVQKVCVCVKQGGCAGMSVGIFMCERKRKLSLM